MVPGGFFRFIKDLVCPVSSFASAKKIVFELAK
jgi:hypothetical protein